jgi:hypothetical protein
MGGEVSQQDDNLFYLGVLIGVDRLILPGELVRNSQCTNGFAVQQGDGNESKRPAVVRFRDVRTSDAVACHPPLFRAVASQVAPGQKADLVLRHFENHKNRSIGVLLPTKRLQFQLVSTLKRGLARRFPEVSSDDISQWVQIYVGGTRQGSDIDISTPGFKVVNYRSAKGLEFDTVFMPCFDECRSDPNADDTPMMFYVLVSRAREELYFTYTTSKSPLLASIPEDLLEWRLAPRVRRK